MQREGQSRGGGVWMPTLSSAGAGSRGKGGSGCPARSRAGRPRDGSTPAAWEEPVLAGNHHTLLPLLTLVHTYHFSGISTAFSVLSGNSNSFFSP